MPSKRHALSSCFAVARFALLVLASVLSVVAAAGAAELGDAAPGCTLTPMSKGAPTELSAAAGEVLLVDFWASWCPVCPHAFLFLNELERDFGGRGLRIVGVSVDEDLDAVREFLGAHPAAFDVVVDPTGSCPAAFGVEGMPASYLIDATGRIRLMTEGFKEEEAHALRREVESWLVDDAPVHAQHGSNSP